MEKTSLIKSAGPDWGTIGTNHMTRECTKAHQYELCSTCLYSTWPGCQGMFKWCTNWKWKWNRTVGNKTSPVQTSTFFRRNFSKHLVQWCPGTYLDEFDGNWFSFSFTFTMVWTLRGLPGWLKRLNSWLCFLQSRHVLQLTYIQSDHIQFQVIVHCKVAVWTPFLKRALRPHVSRAQGLACPLGAAAKGDMDHRATSPPPIPPLYYHATHHTRTHVPLFPPAEETKLCSTVVSINAIWYHRSGPLTQMGWGEQAPLWCGHNSRVAFPWGVRPVAIKWWFSGHKALLLRLWANVGSHSVLSYTFQHYMASPQDSRNLTNA